MKLLVGLAFLLSASAHAYDFSELDVLLVAGVVDGVFPGAVALVAKDGVVVYHQPVGHYTYDPASPAITTDTLFDLASLTKVIATTTAAMLLCDTGCLSLEDPVGKYIPSFAEPARRDICIKHLLTHTSGLRDTQDICYTAECNMAAVTDRIDHVLPCSPVGCMAVYAGVNLIILARVIELVAHEAFDVFVKKYITEPLGMHDTTFNPTDSMRCAPTADATTGRPLYGIVHDDQARVLGGVAGHAGLFATAGDVAKYMCMIMADGRAADGTQFLSPEIVRVWRRRQGPSDRGYGWEIGRHLTREAFGHFGWTGTSMWGDADHRLFCILLTNRVFPTQDNFKIKDFRKKFHDAVMQIFGT